MAYVDKIFVMYTSLHAQAVRLLIHTQGSSTDPTVNGLVKNPGYGTRVIDSCKRRNIVSRIGFKPICSKASLNRPPALSLNGPFREVVHLGS